jgi:hypothetical protein
MRMIVAEDSANREVQQTRTTASAQSSPNVSPSLKHGNRIPAFPPRPSSSETVRPNSQGLLKPFDASENEIEIALREKPPRNISAVSPGSESQSLRRKAILDGLGERDAKRVRMQVNGPGSSPLGDSGEHSNMTLQTRNILKSQEDFDSDTSMPTYTPNMEVDSERGGHNVPDELSSAISVTLNHEKPEIYDTEDNPAEVDSRYIFFDYDDQVVRCRFCGYEVWTPDGFCTGTWIDRCREGLGVYPYYEVLDSVERTRPAIAATEYSEEMIEGLARRDVVGNYLDDDSSAYDSQDEADQHFNEEYDDQDSFIDDEIQPDSDTPDASSLSEGRTDWKEQYNRLQATHTMLLNDYAALADEFDNFRKDALGSDYDSVSDTEDRDEIGMLIVDASAPDPIVTELVLSRVQEQSQELEISIDRLPDRAETLEAARSVDGWHSITMVSVQDNHTHPEIEL